MNVFFVKKPMSHSMTLFASTSILRDNMIKNHKVNIDMNFISKTYVSLSISAGEATYKINEHSKYSDEFNLRLVLEKGWNYFSGKQTENYYFVFNKKQNKEVLRNHIASLVEGVISDFHIEDKIDTNKFTVEVWAPDELEDIRA